MDTREQIAVVVAGHEIRMEIAPDERRHVEGAARQVTERLRKLQEKAPSASPTKLAAMVAFQFACDLGIANEMLDEAEKLHEELKRQREAIQRLESLLEKADEALAV
jgi:cell division protein ZapA (FtsZ GTPase activity inhibitor)